MNFTIKQIRAFVVVAELESFAAAASQLHLSPSAVSLLIRELELQLGLTLFERTTRKVVLSRSGRDMLPTALGVIRQLRAVTVAAADVKNRTTGVIRVAAPLVVATAILPPLIAEYRRKNTTIMIRPVDCAVENLVRYVDEDEADLAIGPDRPAGDSVSRIALADSPWAVWCAAGHSLAKCRHLTWEVLEGEAIIATGRDYEDTLDRSIQGRRVASRLDPTYIVDNVSTALGLAAAGLGVTLAPAYVGVLAKKLGLKKRVLEPEVMRQLCIYEPLQRLRPVPVQEFKQFIVEKIN